MARHCRAWELAVFWSEDAHKYEMAKRSTETDKFTEAWKVKKPFCDAVTSGIHNGRSSYINHDFTKNLLAFWIFQLYWIRKATVISIAVVSQSTFILRRTEFNQTN